MGLKEWFNYEKPIFIHQPPPPTPGLHLPPGVRIPDWRKFKVEDTPELLEVQKKLAARGLKDPWLRFVCVDCIKVMII